MKKFKHKKFGRVAEAINTISIKIDYGDWASNVDIRLVEDSNDWEEIKEAKFCSNGMPTDGYKLLVAMVGVNWEDGCDCYFYDKIKALHKIRIRHAKNDDGFIVNYNGKPFCTITYKPSAKIYLAVGSPAVMVNTFMPYFSSRDKAKECIEECKEHLDILFDIKSK